MVCKAQNKPGHISGTSTFGLVGHRGGALFSQQICNLNLCSGCVISGTIPAWTPHARFGLGRVEEMRMKIEQQEPCPTGCDL